MNNFIDFKKDRNFDQVLQDGFNFLKYNFKSILKYFWQLNSLWTIAFVLISFMYVYFTMDMYSNMFAGIGRGIRDNPKKFDWISIIFMLYSLYFSYRIYATFYGYINSYIRNKGEIKIEDIQETFRHKGFWGYFGLSIVIGFMVVLGFLLLLIPGIWVLVPASLMVPAYFLDANSISEAIDKGFKYVKHNWWYSFGVLLITIIVILFINYLINMPLMLYGVSKAIVVIKDSTPEAISGIVKDPFIIFFSFLSTILKYFLTLIQISVGAVLYYTLKERHTAAGSLERLEQLKDEKDF